MLDPGWIVVITCFGGAFLGAVMYVVAWKFSSNWRMPVDVWTGMLLNSMSLMTLACFIWNIADSIVIAAETHQPTAPLRIDGNEPLVLWILVYSIGQGALSIRRTVLSLVKA